MSAAVERAAMAIAADAGWDWNELPETAFASECKRDFRGHARAAIAALREPDEAMLAAGQGWHGIATCWRRMVDAALDAPQSGKEGVYSDAGPEKPLG